MFTVLFSFTVTKMSIKEFSIYLLALVFIIDLISFVKSIYLVLSNNELMRNAFIKSGGFPEITAQIFFESFMEFTIVSIIFFTIYAMYLMVNLLFFIFIPIFEIVGLNKKDDDTEIGDML